MRLREKFKKWLFKEELQEFEMAMKKNEEATKSLHSAENIYLKSYRLVDDCHKLMNSMMDVGTDNGFCSDDHSWAVVCIKGHPEYVSFMPLTHQNTKEIIDFLKHFKYSNRVIDSPIGFRDMVDHCIKTPFI